MILPGTLPLSIIRGIAFDGVVLRCSDGKVTVSGTLSPNAAAASFVIARLLTTAALTDYWSPTVPLTDEPTGTYLPHGANTGTATATDHPTDLTGLTPKAEVKRTSNSDVTLDLNPSITDLATAEVTIPGISTNDTRDMDFVGTFRWDLVFESGAGERFGPYVKGPFTVSDNITQKPS